MKLPLFPQRPDCTLCDLHAFPRTPGIGTYWVEESLPPSGETPAVVFIGQNPGFDEDCSAMPFVGISGQGLRKGFIEAHDIHKLASIYLTNGVRCRTPHNDTPGMLKYKTCMPYTLEDLSTIRTLHPKSTFIVVTLGRPATLAFHKYILGASGGFSLSDAFKRNGDLVHFTYQDTLPSVFSHHMSAHWFATYHPAYVLREPKAIRTVDAHMTLVVDCLNGVMATPSDPTIISARSPSAYGRSKRDSPK